MQPHLRGFSSCHEMSYTVTICWKPTCVTTSALRWLPSTIRQLRVLALRHRESGTRSSQDMTGASKTVISRSPSKSCIEKGLETAKKQLYSTDSTTRMSIIRLAAGPVCDSGGLLGPGVRLDELLALRTRGCLVFPAPARRSRASSATEAILLGSHGHAHVSLENLGP